MKAHGLNPKTEPTNKVPLSGDRHDITKRDSYGQDTNDRIANQPDADAIRQECCQIGENLKDSSMEYLNRQSPQRNDNGTHFLA